MRLSANRTSAGLPGVTSSPHGTRPHVVHVLDRLSVGGMETVLLDVIAATRTEYSHHVICLRERGVRAVRAEAMGVSVESIDKRAGKDLAAYGRLWRRLQALSPAIVHSYNIGALEACVPARLAGVKYIVHAEHGRDVSDPYGENRKYRLMRRALAPLISRFVPVSRDLAAWLIRDIGIAERKVVPVCNGIDTARFAPDESSGYPRHSSANPAAPDKRPIAIGSVGRLDAVKGFDTLIDAFAVLCRRFPDRPMTLEIVGDGPERGNLVRCIEDLGLVDRVVLAGPRDDVETFLQSLDIYVCSSVAEGIALTVLEAMAAARPVVATRVGGNPELVDAGHTGVLVEPKAPEALADALAAYVENPQAAAAAGRAGRARAVAEFDLAVMADRYRALYGQLLGRSRTTRASTVN